jgi:Thiol-activated cytolysin
MKIKTVVYLAAFAVAALLSSCNKNPVAPNNSVNPADATNIDSLVSSVPEFQQAPTWPTRVDSTSTDTTSTVDTSGTQVDSTTWLVQNVSYSASADPSTYMMYNPQASVLWPGNLVQGNSIASGVPNSIPITNRAPGNISLAILSGDSAGTANKFYRTINQFQFSTVNQAMNSILAGYQGGTPAKYSYTMEQVYSASQLNFDLSLGYTGPSVSASGQLGLSFSSSKTYFAVQLTQQFFTMVYDDPQGASGAFGPGFTASELAPYTGPGNPVCYISSVTYGRIYILIYESTASSQDLSAALNFAYNGGVASGNIKSTADFDKVMSQTTVQVVQIGGDPQAGLTAATALSYSAINSFMTLGADFSSTNIGAPISYTVKYLKDATLVRMNSVMQYTVSQKTPISTSTGYTKSPINIFVSDLSITQNTLSQPNGGCKVVVGVTNVQTGQDSVVWTSPITNGAGGSPLYDGTSGWFDFGATDMTAGTDFQLNFTAPQMLMDNGPNEKLWVDFWINDFNGSTNQRNWAYQRLYLQYDQTQQAWVRTGPQGSSATQMPVSNPDVGGTFNFTITINGVQLQQ